MTDSEYDDGPQPTPEPGQWLRAARVGKPHGLRGEVTVQLFTDEPAERLAPGAVINREPGKNTGDQSREPLTVTSQRWNKQICLLGFEQVPDRNAAEALRGSELFIPVPQETGDDEQWYSHELEGMRCLGPQDQELGVIVELVTGAAQDLLMVRTPAGEEVMVPFVEELVPEIEAEAKTIRLNPPPGLFP